MSLLVLSMGMASRNCRYAFTYPKRKNNAAIMNPKSQIRSIFCKTNSITPVSCTSTVSIFMPISGKTKIGSAHSPTRFISTGIEKGSKSRKTANFHNTVNALLGSLPDAILRSKRTYKIKTPAATLLCNKLILRLHPCLFVQFHHHPFQAFHLFFGQLPSVQKRCKKLFFRTIEHLSD